MKLCFSTLGCTERTLDQIIKTANKYGIKYLEIRGIGDHMDNRNIKDFAPENIGSTVEKLKANGISIVSLDTSCMMHNIPNEALIEEAIATVDIAKKLGAKYIRVFGNELKGDREAVTAHVISGIKAICEHAEGTGVKVLLEVHGDFNSIQTIAPIAKALASYKSFGILWDIMHTHNQYGDNWAEFYEYFKPLICHIHVKDAIKGKLVVQGEGEIPFVEIARRMTNDGFEGCFSLEWEKKWHPELPEIESALEGFVKTAENV